MSKTHDEIIIELREAAQAPLGGQRSLAGMVRKTKDLIAELRADHSWEELSLAMAEVGYAVNAETLRRTVRRAQQNKSSKANAPLRIEPAADPLQLADNGKHQTVVMIHPQARDPPCPPLKDSAPNRKTDNVTLQMGGDLLDDLRKLKDLNQ